MFSPNNLANTIKDLPNEVLCHILDLCRPDDFEPAVLACKRFYEITQHLISWHNICKRRLCDPALEKTTTGHIILRDPFDFLEWLLTLPPLVRVDQFRYLKRIDLLSSSNLSPSDNRALIDRIRNKFPHLHTAISCVERDLYNTADTEYQKMISTYSSALDDYFGNGSTYSSQPRPTYYEVILLGPFSNLESLILEGIYFTHPSIPLFDLISRNKDHIIFYRLQELCIRGGSYFSYARISAFLWLPRLRTLMMEEFNRSYIQPQDAEETETYDSIFSIETLILFRATWQPQYAENYRSITSLAHFDLGGRYIRAR